MSRKTSPIIIVAACMLALGGPLWGSAGLAGAGPLTPPVDLSSLEELGWGAPRAAEQQPHPLLDLELLAKAAPDECYAGIGDPYPPGPPCSEGVPKANQAYVWGLAKTRQLLWFGTAPNVHCVVLSGYLGQVVPHETSSWVCEYGESQYAPPLPAGAGDWRSTHIYVYDLEEQALTDRTPVDPRIGTVGGIRSAGAHNDVVFLAGPDLQGGVDLFAFDSETQAYLGSANLPQYSNIRKWLSVGGVLYTAVRNTAGGGSVLRWSGDAADPFQFDVVGNLDSEGVELAWHEGRIFLTTWPDLQAEVVQLAGLYMSPPLPAAGLTAAEADGWQEVWESSDYEPDPVTAATYGGGALASFDGYLYWGTMHVPLTAALGHVAIYGPPPDIVQQLLLLLRTHRAISVFRGRDFGAVGERIDLLYGERELSKYVYTPSTQAGRWQRSPNNMGAEPLLGASGFGNPYNNYTWTMDVFEGQLYVGTMDWSYLLSEGLPILTEVLLGFPLSIPPWLPFGDFGADLMRFSSPDLPAVPESTSGVGNYTNYGVRTMLADDALYIGTANPMNLLTDLLDDRPEGGWELLRLSRRETHDLYFPMQIR